MTTPLRLTHVSLNRFKAAYRLSDVPLRSFNVIIGRNGVGKSTLLEGLQWIDAAVRGTVNVACDRYNGITDLINHRSAAGPPGFELHTRFATPSGGFASYGCRIEAHEGLARVREEHLRIGSTDAPTGKLWLTTDADGVRGTPTTRLPGIEDRLALARIDELLPDPGLAVSGPDIAAFWQNAVFLRLEPTDLARGAPLRRPSLAPLLDEVGAMLPALIAELDDDARQDLTDMLQSVLPDFRDVEILQSNRAGNYALREDIIFKGKAGHKSFAIPSWMLSEGTRRMTAIFALLAHRPGPSLLCIEEVENGLDPISVRKVLGHLEEASRRGVQVILTTHSPWLLDDVELADVQIVRRALGDTTYTRLQDDPRCQQADPRVRPGGRYIDILET